VDRQLPTFAKASQNVATLLDMLPAPSAKLVGEVYQRLKSILSTATAQQVESFLQHWVMPQQTPHGKT
jgi:Na+-translocating ferredoxin:NAD+ oxidoreductase RnfG subunit